MRNDLITYALFIFTLSGFLANCANAQSNQLPITESKSSADLSTDEAIIAELQKIIDAKNAELTKGDEKLVAKQKAASKLEAKDVCIKRLKESAKIIVVGFFRTDVGCRFDGAFVDSRYYERENSDVSEIALAALGWEKANQTERETLAKIWVEKGLLVFAPLPNQSLSAVSTGDGEIKVTASSKYPPGVTSRSTTKSFVFDKDGKLISG